MSNNPPNRIKEIRESKGWTQAEVARFLRVDPATVSNHENGKRGMDSEIVKEYATLFQLDNALELFYAVSAKGEFKKSKAAIEAEARE